MGNYEIATNSNIDETEKLIKSIDMVINASCEKICNLLDNNSTIPSKMIDALANLVTARASIKSCYSSLSKE